MDKISDSKYNPQKYHRRSIRLKDYDYSQAGAYFVTICVKEKKPGFGNIQKGKMMLSPFGKIAYRCWKQIPSYFDLVKLDTFLIMPNHFHCILFLNVGARFIVPYNKEGFDKSNPYIRNNPMVSNPTTLGKIIRFFKAKTTHQVRNIANFKYFQWQRNYYEHVVRNENELNLIRQYILYNPLQWQYDRENPEHIQDKSYENQWGDFEEILYGKICIISKSDIPV